MPRVGAAVLVAACGIATGGAGEPAPPWREIAPGLELAELKSPVASAAGDSTVTVVRVDPARYEFRLLSSKLLDLEANLPASAWVEKYGLTGAMNASMYREDHRTSVSFMRDGEALNNGRWSKDNAVFVSGPREPGLPPVQILDRTCDDADDVARRYRVVVQSIRMLDCSGKNTWARQPRSWSTACLGTDDRGRVLLIHCRSPYPTHDFIEILRGLPLALKRLMYVEGGPEASLFVRQGDREVVRRVGSFETGFLEHDGNHELWPIPNVIGFLPR